MNTSPIIEVPQLEHDFQPIEIRPSFRTIKIKSNGTIYEKRLAFPYMQFFGLRIPNRKYHICKVTWSLKSLTSLNDLVAMPILPNIYTNSVICTGREDSSSLDLCNNFWSSLFVPADIARYQHKPEIKTFFDDEWEPLSQKAKHPLDVFEKYYNYDEEFEFYKYLLGVERGAKITGCYYLICRYLEHHESITCSQIAKIRRLFAFPCIQFQDGENECKWFAERHLNTFKMENTDEGFTLSIINRTGFKDVLDYMKRYCFSEIGKVFIDYIEQHNWKADL